MNDAYPYDLDNAVTERLRCRDALGAWDALHELADAILDRAIPLIAARPKLEARLLTLLKHLVDTDAPLTIDQELARRTIIERLRKPATLEGAIDEFRAQVHALLAPWRFHDYLGVERLRLSAYLETIARERLKRRPGAKGTVDDVFADVLAKAYETGVWELPPDPEWTRDLARRVRNRADGRKDRRDRREKCITSSDDPEALAPPPSTGGVDTPGGMSSQEAGLYIRENFEMLSPRERLVLELKLQGYSNKEISRKRGTPLRTVERLLWRIRWRLRGGEE